MWPFKKSVRSQADKLAHRIAPFWFFQVTDLEQLRREITTFDVDNPTLALVMGYGCGLAVQIHHSSVPEDARNPDVIALAVALVARHHLGKLHAQIGLTINDAIDKFFRREDMIRMWEPFFAGKCSPTFQAGWVMGAEDVEEKKLAPTRLKNALAQMEKGILPDPPDRPS